MPLQQTLENLMSIDAEVRLDFSDGYLMASSTALRMASPVLRNALEAHTAGAGSGADNSGSSAKTSASSSSNGAVATIPIDGVTKEEWLEVAAFVYPVVPAPKFASLDQAVRVLGVASKYDLQLALTKVDEYLAASASVMVGRQGSPSNIWRFIQLADDAGLEVCLQVLAARAVDVDRRGCAAASNKTLSNRALVCLVNSLVEKFDFKKRCACNGTISVSMKCNSCGGNYSI